MWLIDRPTISDLLGVKELTSNGRSSFSKEATFELEELVIVFGLIVCFCSPPNGVLLDSIGLSFLGERAEVDGTRTSIASANGVFLSVSY